MRSVLILLILLVPACLFSQTEISSGEYWFDSDRSTLQEIFITSDLSIDYSASLDISSLNDGLHTYHIRFQDKNLNWSGTVSRFFFKMGDSNIQSAENLTKYQYWFDNDMSGTQTVDIVSTANFTLNESFNTESLGKGLHTLNLRLADNTGRWSSVLSSYFVKITDQNLSSADVTELEYWIDNCPENLTSIAISDISSFEYLDNIDFTSVSPGLHTITLRFKDSNQQYSSPLTRFFVNLIDNEPIGNNLITGYRYWFSDTLIHNVELSSPASVVLLDEEIDMRLIEKGEHILNLQIRDKDGRWSGTITDTLEKISYPYAVLSAEATEGCANDSILLKSIIIDADSISWNFGDGNFSSLTEVKKSWDIAGNYSVSAQVFDKVNDLSGSYQLNNEIVINPLPLIDIADSLKINTDESETVDAGEGFISYLWNGVSGSNLYTFDGSDLGVGNFEYSVIVENEYGCINSDTIIISVSVASGIEDELAENIKIYPNPVKDFLNIKWNDIGTYRISISIVDRNGRLHKARRLISPVQAIDLSELKAGSYFVLLEINRKIISVPIVKL